MKHEEKFFIILTPGFAASEQDANCLPMQQLFVRTLNENYPELNIIVLAFQYPYRKDNYGWDGATVYSFNGRNKGGLQKLRLRYQVISVLKNIREQGEIIGLLSFWFGECAYVANKFSKKYKVKHVCWLLGQDARTSNGYLKKIKLGSGEMVALSDFLQEEMERNYGTRPVTVIPPGMDARQFGHFSFERDIDILAAGSLISLKRYDVLMDVIHRIKNFLPGVKVVLAGDGPEKEKLTGLIDRLNLKDSVTLPGELPHDELLRMMQRSKVFLHTSSYEGFSGVCMEALGAGAHVISFCRAMNREIRQWHIVGTEEEMVTMALEILQNDAIDYEPLTMYKMDDTVERMMQLFQGA